jgi:phosphate starvation-inducible protein PhoH
LPRKQATKSKPKAFETGFTLRDIKPLTENQAAAFEHYEDGKHLLLAGMAGTGKSFIALYLCLKDLIEGKLSSVLIMRSTVPSRDMGFLPGTLEEKLSAYEDPYRQIVNNLFGRDDAWFIMCKKGHIKLSSTSYLRGVTYKNVGIILDESQNCTLHELDTVITRVGSGCRVFVCGDERQSDLIGSKIPQGMTHFRQILSYVPEFRSVSFGIEDIVRSGLVKNYILAKHKLGLN